MELKKRDLSVWGISNCGAFCICASILNMKKITMLLFSHTSILHYSITPLLLLMCSGCATAYKPLPPEAIRPVIAVTSFSNRSSFAGQWELGSGMADMLVSELLTSQNFTVVERAHLKNVLSEMKLQENDNFRQEGKVLRGRLKNAQYLIRGDINDFSQVGGGSLGLAVRSFIFGGKGYKARVSVTLTIIDIESGEILESVQASGDARAREAYAQGTYKNIRFGGDTFFKTPLGKATGETIKHCVHEVIKKVPIKYWTPMIAEVTSRDMMVINGGTNRGIALGAVYSVRAPGRSITDPVTGDVLETIPGPVIGRVKIVKVLEKISYAQPVKGDGFKRGMRLSK